MLKKGTRIIARTDVGTHTVEIFIKLTRISHPLSRIRFSLFRAVNFEINRIFVPNLNLLYLDERTFRLDLVTRDGNMKHPC